MTKYTDMYCSERDEHHLDLANQGVEWCPECGELLDWHPEPDATAASFRAPSTYIAGDYPPITGADLVPIL